MPIFIGRDCAQEGSDPAETAAAAAAVVRRNCRRDGLLMAVLLCGPLEGGPYVGEFYSMALTMSSTTFLASPNTIIVLSI
jgi:hypothetical protein